MVKVPKLDVTRRPGYPRYRKVYHLKGVSPPGEVLVHNSNCDNLVRGLVERVMYQKVDGRYVGLKPPERGAFEGDFGEFRKRVLESLVCPPVVTLDKVPEMYRGRQRTIMENAVLSLWRKAVRIYDSATGPFVKAEKMLKPDPKPRIIQCRSPRYVAMCAKYLKKLEGPLLRAINKTWGSTTMMKGLNGEQRGRVIAAKWKSFHDCVAVGIDATAFDQHVSTQALRYEHSFYNGAYHSDELSKLLRWQLTNQGVGRCWDGKVRYKVEGKRMSGDLNTSMGNSLLMCSMVWCWSREVGLHCQFVNDGDDGVIFLERKDLARFGSFHGWFGKRGFEMKMEAPVDVLERVEFCQCQPVLTSRGSYIMTRQPKNAIRKDTTTFIPLDSKKAFETWMSSVALCGLALCTGVPVMESFYRMYQRVGGNPGRTHDNTASQSGFYFMARGVDTTGNEITPEVRHSFWLAFGMTPDVQVALEQYYDLKQLKYGIGPAPLDGSPAINSFRAHPNGALFI